MAEMGSKGYTSRYDARTKDVDVIISEDKLASLGGPDSQATDKFVNEILADRKYCQKYTRSPRYRNAAGGYSIFPGRCS